MGNTSNDWWDLIPDNIRYLIIAGLFGGIGSGMFTLTADTSDRYHASTASRDFALRDTQIRHALEEIKDIKHTVQRIDDTHPPPDLIKRLDTLEAKVWSMQLEKAKKQ